MRPVRRNTSPIDQDFTHYRDAFTPLLSKISVGSLNGILIGQYCSYCEREIPTNLAVEHVIPKDGPNGDDSLKNSWRNFLLACVNCNSTKGRKLVVFEDLLLPDRDNTYLAITYTYDGEVIPNPEVHIEIQEKAQNTIDLVGLNNEIQNNDEETEVAIDRRQQRINAWLNALDSLEDYERDPSNVAVEKGVIKSMLGSGFFSIWMTVFSSHQEVRNRFIDAISGTRSSGCFDENSQIITPCPNLDGLLSGGKI